MRLSKETSVALRSAIEADKQYGLTSQTVLFYSDMVRCGFDWGLAMAQLKELYDNNKAIALSQSSTK